MKGDIAFVGFMLTSDEWQALDVESRAQLIAVATRRLETPVERPRRFPEGTGKHEVLELIEDDLLEPIDDDLLELEADDPDSNLEPASTKSVDDGWEDFSDLNEI